MRTTYPFALHGLCLVPVIVVLCCVQLFIGSEDAVYTYFSALQKAHPAWVAPIDFFSNAVPMLFYPLYLSFFLRGLRGKKAEDVFFVLAYVLAQVLIVALLARCVKIAVGRPRPMTGGPFVPFSFGWGYQSFPSGHTGEIVGSVIPLLWRYGNYRPYALSLLCGIVVAAVAFSRLFLCMHHPTDIWGGLVFGSFSGYAAWALYTTLLPRWRNRLPRPIRDWLDLAGNK